VDILVKFTELTTAFKNGGNLPRMDKKLQPGDLLRDGQYEIQQALRSVRDKEVYLARDRMLRCQVTVDVFSNDFIMPSGLNVSAWEAQVLGSLGDHPNIANVLNYWMENDVAIMVTRYLCGERLEDRIIRLREAGAGLTVQEILQLSTEIASGLAYIHRCRILYRDLQPHNVLFDEWDTSHLVDFDTAVSLDDDDDDDMNDLSRRPVIGYMAPELIDGRDADERADLFSLGATIYEMCDGVPPFTGTREQILAAQRSGPPFLKRDDLPAGLQELVLCLLAPNAEKRPQSAAEVMGRLDGLRTAHANLSRLLASNVGTVLKAALKAYLKADSGALAQSPSAVNLPDDHRCLMQAIMALAETDHRRAVIDANTATEVALRSAIADKMRKARRSDREIDRVLWDANGVCSSIQTIFHRCGRASVVG
jgi:serine/threonine protein kinase